MIQTYPNVDWTQQGMSWPIHIYTLITSQWQRSSEESAFMKVKTKEPCCKAHYCEFHKVHPHIFGAYPVKANNALLHLQFPFWEEACSGSMLVSFEETNDLKWSEIDFTRGNPGKHILTRSRPAIFFSQTNLSQIESPNGALYWFGADCAGEAPVVGASLRVPLQCHPAQELKGSFKVSLKDHGGQSTVNQASVALGWYP